MVAIEDVGEAIEIGLDRVAEGTPHRQAQLIAIEVVITGADECGCDAFALAAERPVAGEHELGMRIRIEGGDLAYFAGHDGVVLRGDVHCAGDMRNRVFQRETDVEHPHAARGQDLLKPLGADLGSGLVRFQKAGLKDSWGRRTLRLNGQQDGERSTCHNGKDQGGAGQAVQCAIHILLLRNRRCSSPPGMAMYNRCFAGD